MINVDITTVSGINDDDDDDDDITNYAKEDDNETICHVLFCSALSCLSCGRETHQKRATTSNFEQPQRRNIIASSKDLHTL